MSTPTAAQGRVSDAAHGGAFALVAGGVTLAFAALELGAKGLPSLAATAGAGAMAATSALAFACAGASLLAQPLSRLAAAALAFATGACAALRLAAPALGWEGAGGFERFLEGLLGLAPKEALMAPGAALGLLLLASALVPLPRAASLRMLLGAMSGLLGLVATIGHATGLRPALGGPDAAPMAATSALALMLAAAGAVVAARRDTIVGRAPGDDAFVWRDPILLALLTAGGTVGLTLSLRADADARVRAAGALAAERFQALLSAVVDSRIQGLSFHALEWEVRGRPTASDLERNAVFLTEVSPAFQALEWVDARGVLRGRYPESAPKTLPPAVDQIRGELAGALRAARTRRSAVVSELVRIGADGTGFRVVVPVFRLGGEPDGHLAGVYDARAELTPLLASLAPDYASVVEAGGIELYRRGEIDPARVAVAAVDLPGGAQWTVRVSPAGALRSRRLEALPWLVLTSGLAIAVLLALVLRLGQEASARAAALARTNVELEERVRARTADLARSNEDLKQFASFVAHELRQPLGTLTLWLELLEGRPGLRDDGESRDYLKQIRLASVRMADMVSAQLELAAIGSGTADFVAVPLDRVVRDAERELAHELLGAGARVELGPLPVVRGDPRQLVQLVQNLLANAIKYRRTDVPLVIRIRGERQDGEELVRVEDNGRGFTPEQAERIFRAFQRLDPDAAEGAGLGLAICRRIVLRHGGTIGAEGRPGEGATFWIRLPAVSARR
jgi:signal transduction histidine kinase